VPIIEIDGLRGIAILLVLMTHLWPGSGSAAALQPLMAGGWIGVDLFFVISGFLIMGILIDTKGSPGYYRNFYARRILRIFPLYYCFLGAVFIGMPMIQGASYGESQFGQEAGSPLWYLFYLTNFREALGGEGIPRFIRPLWSLAIEEQFYLLFPVVVAAISLRALTRLLAGLVAFAFVLRVTLLLAWPDNHHLQYLLTPTRFDTIALGSLAAIMIRHQGSQARLQRILPLAPWLAVGLLVLVGSRTGFDRRSVDLRTWGYSAIALAFTLLVVWTVRNAGKSTLQWLRNGVLCLFGRLCYGIYVLHLAAALVAGKLISAVIPPLALISWLEFPVAVAAALLAAWISWRGLEEPILRLKRRFEYRSATAT
jgi:peptidoglycan/LPS O-acetylase OafA/YrhL